MPFSPVTSISCKKGLFRAVQRHEKSSFFGRKSTAEAAFRLLLPPYRPAVRNLIGDFRSPKPLGASGFAREQEIPALKMRQTHFVRAGIDLVCSLFRIRALLPAAGEDRAFRRSMLHGASGFAREQKIPALKVRQAHFVRAGIDIVLIIFGKEKTSVQKQSHGKCFARCRRIAACVSRDHLWMRISGSTASISTKPTSSFIRSIYTGTWSDFSRSRTSVYRYRLK